jgi:hypothetical protein
LYLCVDVGPCWFCLGSPNIAKHLLASIGETFYVALPKGGIIDSQATLVPGGGHVLVIPIQHCDSLRTLPDSQMQTEWAEEMQKYIKSLTALYARYEAVPVVFEISRPGANQHMHFQASSIQLRLLNITHAMHVLLGGASIERSSGYHGGSSTIGGC